MDFGPANLAKPAKSPKSPSDRPTLDSGPRPIFRPSQNKTTFIDLSPPFLVGSSRIQSDLIGFGWTWLDRGISPDSKKSQCKTCEPGPFHSKKCLNPRPNPISHQRLAICHRSFAILAPNPSELWSSCFPLLGFTWIHLDLLYHQPFAIGHFPRSADILKLRYPAFPPNPPPKKT